MGKETADAENQSSEGRQRPALQQAFKNQLKPRYHKRHENGQNREGNNENRTGVKHGRFDLAPQFLRLLQKVGEARQSGLQRASNFPRLDHVDKKGIESFGL